MIKVCGRRGLAVLFLVLPLVLVAACGPLSAPEPASTGASATAGAAGIASAGATAGAAVSASASPSASPTASADVEKMIGGPRAGWPYFSDPYPVYRTSHGTSVADPHIVFGTSDAVLLCPGQIRPGCYTRRPVVITMSEAITAQAAAAGTVIVATQNHNPFQNDDGAWSMALTVTVRQRSGHPSGHWDVVLHAHPAGPSDPVPTTWVADSVLAGSLAVSQDANYDGKYYEANGALYLLYSKRLSSGPARDGIVAQRMRSPRQPDGTAPAVLLQPAPGTGFTSEDFFAGDPGSSFKLVETGNITRIDGKYVMAYSTGDFEENDYKIAVAWSKTFLPPPGSTYAKLVTPDPSNLWRDREDVSYLMQSQEPQAPHYVGGQVLAPGVPSIVQDGRRWYLIFAGYQPGGQVPATFNPASRQPYLVPLCLTGSASIIVACTR